VQFEYGLTFGHLSLLDFNQQGPCTLVFATPKISECARSNHSTPRQRRQNIKAPGHGEDQISISAAPLGL